MKNILHILLFTFFSFNIISCSSTTIMLGALGGGAAYWYQDDISSWYDDFSKEIALTDNTDETKKSDTRSEKARPIFVAVGGYGTIITSSNGTKWTRKPSGTKAKLRAISYGNGTLVVVGYSGIILTSSDGTIWSKKVSGTKKHLGNVTYGKNTFVAVGNSGTITTS